MKSIQSLPPIKSSKQFCDAVMAMDTLRMESRVVQWAGPSVSRPTVGVVIASPSHRVSWSGGLGAAVHGSLSRMFGEREVSVHECHDTASLCGHTLSFDLLVVCMDTSRLDCADWARRMVLQCSEDLRPGRVVLVNGGGLPALDQAVPPDTIVDLKRELGVHLMSGNLDDDVDRERIAKRASLVVAAVVGLHSGIPYPAS